MSKVLVQNRKARHDYEIEEEFEAGVVLNGSEVKSLRQGRGSLVDCFAVEKAGEIFIQNCYIPPYEKSSDRSYKDRRSRKLLLHKKQINKIIGAINKKGKTVAVLSLYLNDRNLVKASIAIASGRKKYDKRQVLKERDIKRQQERDLR